MPRLIDADAFFNDFPELRDYEYASQEYEVDAEPTEEQVKEYCRKRCLAIVTSELFNEMKARWSAEPVRHGHWINHHDDLFPEESTQECSVCHAEQMGTMLNDNYCPNCGAKMDESSQL